MPLKRPVMSQDFLDLYFLGCKVRRADLSLCRLQCRRVQDLRCAAAALTLCQHAHTQQSTVSLAASYAYGLRAWLTQLRHLGAGASSIATPGCKTVYVACVEDTVHRSVI